MFGERKIVILALALAALAFAAPGAEAVASPSIAPGAHTQGGTSFTAWLIDLVGGAVDYVLEHTLP